MQHQQPSETSSSLLLVAPTAVRFLLQNETNNTTTATTNATSTNEENSDGSDMLYVVGSNVLLFLLIFGLSATVQIKNLRQQLQNTFALLTGIGMQFFVMPLLGFLAVVALKGQAQFTEAMGLTLLVVTASPGGSYSNWWCSLFNADLALSVAMTSVSTILSIGLLPANLLLYSHLAYGQGDPQADSLVGAIDFGALFISLGVVMCAILTGLTASYYISNPTFSRWCNRGASISGLGLILVSLFLSSSGGGDDDEASPIWDQHWTFYVGVAFPCFAGIFLANFFARSFRLKRPEIVAIAIECCYQNTGIATSVAVTMFDDPKERAQAVAIPLLYGFVEALVIGIYCVFAWKIGWTKAPKNENCCTVIATSYEIEEEDFRCSNTAQDHHQDENGDEKKPPDADLEAAGEARIRKVTSSTVASEDGFACMMAPPCTFSRSDGGPPEQPTAGTGTSPSSSRIRFASEDVTVTTQESTTPPVTPIKSTRTESSMFFTPPPPIRSVPSASDSDRTWNC